MSRWQKLLLPVASAVLCQLAFPPLELRFLVFVALVPWLLRLRVEDAKGAFRAGYLMGFIIVLCQMYFLVQFVAKWTGSTVLGMIPWLVCGVIGAFYFAIAGVLIRSCMLRGWYWLIPIVWAGIEVVRSFIVLVAFPWFILSMPLGHWPALDQTAFFGTIYFVSAWVVLCNLCIYWLVTRVRPRALPAYWSVAAALPIISLFMYFRPINGTTHLVAIGQPGVDMAFGDKGLRVPELEYRILRIEQNALEKKAEFLILPEGMVDGGDYPPAVFFPLPRRLPILFGAQRGHDPAHQSAVLYDRGIWSYADKSRLVEFGEYVPGRDIFPFLKAFNLPSGDIEPGKKVSAVNVNGVIVGPLICFEGLFYDIGYQQSRNHAQLLAVMSIDDWYMGSVAPEQLRDSCAWRAMENNLPLVRVASLGYSDVVDQRGRVQATLPLGQTADLTYPIKLEDNPTGNPLLPVFPWISGLSPFALTLYLLWSRRRRHEATEEKN